MSRSAMPFSSSPPSAEQRGGKGARRSGWPLLPATQVAPHESVASRETGHPAYSQSLPREARSAEVARRLVRTALTVWGLESLVEDATLVITELVANAVDHSRLPSIRVIVSRPSSHEVRVGVVDRSRTVPLLRTDVDGDRLRGRGLVLVDALTEAWGTELYRWGKQVWAELRDEGEGSE
ncbi:ATP-binding protein [Streptomyces sp. NPDC090303]|uniref:ATP-binding protein n=1 Tax=Streptomyces sp. NPDC090303 TaxID=3365960 RepID=UPI003824BFA2